MSSSYLQHTQQTEMDMQQNRMTEGSEESSYVQNSLIQTNSIVKAFPVIHDALEGLYSTMTPRCVVVAELGCASGPNTLRLIPEFIEFTYKKFMAMNEEQIPQIQFFLNDLYFNDFNTMSQSIPAFLRELEKERNGNLGLLSISMTPSCYRKRIFPDNFLHFVHCANSAHWLTKIPNAISEKDGESLTKGCIYITETSPPEMVKTYQEQFAKDLSSFLDSRAHEIVQGGRMVINIMVSSEEQGPEHFWILRLYNMVLRDMLLEGLVDEKKVSEFNIPFYPPTMEEVKKLVESEDSFILHKHETFTLDWDMPEARGDKIDELKRVRFVAGTARVAIEYMISTHFGEAFEEELYRRFTDLVYQHLKAGIPFQTFHQIISLIKK